jgi:hypothetical protein
MNEQVRPDSRRRVIRFFGGATIVTVNKLLASYISAGQFDVHVFADNTFSDDVDLIRASEHASYQGGKKNNPWRVTPRRVDDWSDEATFKKGYKGSIHMDPDELIFQHEPADATVMHHAWDIGHWVTCGVVASDAAAFADLVSEHIAKWPGPFVAADVERILASFEGQDVSELAQKLIRSSETIKFWYPKEVEAVTA